MLRLSGFCQSPWLSFRKKFWVSTSWIALKQSAALRYFPPTSLGSSAHLLNRDVGLQLCLFPGALFCESSPPFIQSRSPGSIECEGPFLSEQQSIWPLPLYIFYVPKKCKTLRGASSWKIIGFQGTRNMLSFNACGDVNTENVPRGCFGKRNWPAVLTETGYCQTSIILGLLAYLLSSNFRRFWLNQHCWLKFSMHYVKRVHHFTLLCPAFF